MSAARSNRPRWGQNFLVDTTVARRIVDWADVAGRRVLEIGPGRGALTETLAERAADLTLVEIDPVLIETWRERFDGNLSVRVVAGDALTVDLEPVFTSPTTVVANLPYESGTAIVARLLDGHGPSIDSMVVMLQREVCRRLRARAGMPGYGVLSVMTAIAADVDAGFSVAPGSFRPPPKVYSEVVRLRPLGHSRYDTGDAETFRHVVKLSFGQRRKMLRNTLGKWMSERWGVEGAESLFDEAGVDPSLRPERVDVERFAALSLAIHRRA